MTKLATMFFEEGYEVGFEIGRNKAKQIIAELRQGKSPEEIAETMNVSIDLVLEWKDLLES